MINHVRTLLLNRDGAGSPGADYPGEELVPADYRVVPLPDGLVQLRRTLFGTDPDRLMLNYRLRQYMTLLHASPLGRYVTALDPRITYLDHGRQTLFDPATYQPQIAQSAGSPATLHVHGEPLDPEPAGRALHQYRLTILSGTSVEVVRQTPPLSSTIENFALDQQLGPRLDLPGSGYVFRLTTAAVGSTWRVTIRNRPLRGLGQIVEAAASAGAPAALEAFGIEDAEPYATFRNLWRTHPDTPYRLSGLLLALAYRTEELRHG